MQTTEIPHKNKMIKYNLKCKNKHEFESWFFDSNEFEKLKKKKLLECIFCKSKNVKKSIMSPKIINLSRKIKANKVSNIEYQKAKEELIKPNPINVTLLKVKKLSTLNSLFINRI